MTETIEHERGFNVGRRANNPDLVQELIDRRWDDTMGQEEYEEKYYSLSSSDMSKVAEAIDGMEKEFFEDNDSDDNDEDSEALSVWNAADIYASNGFDEDYQFGYSHEELMEALGN